MSDKEEEARERVARDLRDLADSMREQGEAIDKIADAIEQGVPVEEAYEKAVENQFWKLAKALEPARGENR